MDSCTSLILYILFFLWLNVAGINLNVFVVRTNGFFKNKAMWMAVINPFSLFMKCRTKQLIISAELMLAENAVYKKRSVINEKKISNIVLSACESCHTIPEIKIMYASANGNVCVKCLCGKCFLPQNNIFNFLWLFPEELLNYYDQENKSKIMRDVLKRCKMAMAFEWNKLPNMYKRDDVLITMKMMGFERPISK